jgi:hypothetical protein
MPGGDALLARYPNVVRAHTVISRRASFTATDPG